MSLNEAALKAFERDGFWVQTGAVCPKDVDLLLCELSTVSRHPAAPTYEADGTTMRGVHGCHATSGVFSALARLPSLLGPAQQLLRAPVYVYQFKINLKAAFTGDVWPWHQDFSFWSIEDGMPAPCALTAAIFLDEVSQFNGPMYLIPGSQCHSDSEAGQFRNAGVEDWESNFGNALKYQVNHARVSDLVRQGGLCAPTGSPGTVVFFHCNIVHASPSNISPSPRRIVFVTYNSIYNLPSRLRRPDFLVSRYERPLLPLNSMSLVDLTLE